MKNIPQLKQWLLNKPVIFGFVFIVLSTILTLIYSLIQTFLHYESMWPMYIIFGFSFVYAIYYMIKKLPHDAMHRGDFIAITNGTNIISIVSSIIAVLGINAYGENAQQKIMMTYPLYPTTFKIAFFIISLISIYLLGVAISGVYAKYKRATTMGISPWRVILSMPFGFLMMWTPGYLIEEKGKKSNLLIKSHWYNRFNNWVVSSFSNTLTVFLFLMVYKCAMAGMATGILTCALLILYAIWYKKHTKDFVKNINSGYALTAIGINLAILTGVILTIG